MRRKYLLPTVIALLLLSCKKDTTAITNAQPVVSTNDYTICIDDKWVADVLTQENEADLVVVYNNKSYSFHNNWQLAPNDPRRKKIRIFDGTSWEVKSSDMPLRFEPLYINFAFVIGNKAYFGYTCNYIGSNDSHGETWQYNFTTNNWTPMDDFPDYHQTGGAYFTVGTKGYLVGGQKQGPPYTNLYKTWEFNPSAANQWTQKANLPGVGRYGSAGFSIGSKGYMVAGRTYLPNPYDDVYNKALFEYNPTNDSWAIKAEFPGIGRESAKSFVIDNKAYVGGGFVRPNSDPATYLYDFYEYNPANNDWTRVDNYGLGGSLEQCYSINSKGYAVWKPTSDVFADPLRMKRYTPLKCTTIITPNMGTVSNN